MGHSGHLTGLRRKQWDIGCVRGIFPTGNFHCLAHGQPSPSQIDYFSYLSWFLTDPQAFNWQAFRSWIQCYITGLIQQTQYFPSRIMQRNPKAGIYIWEWLVWEKKYPWGQQLMADSRKVQPFSIHLHTHLSISSALSLTQLLYALLRKICPPLTSCFMSSCLFHNGQVSTKPRGRESHHQYTTPIQLLLRIM